MPVQEDVTIPYSDLRTKLLPVLHGRVFHVTTSRSLDSIMSDGAVLVNPENKVWDYDSYFRSVGCVSLCDLRTVADDKVDFASKAYYFLDPRSEVGDPVFLLLSKRAETSVVTYEEAKEAAIGKMLVPFIEAGFPGDLPLDQIETIISVTVERPDEHPFTTALKLAGRLPEQ